VEEFIDGNLLGVCIPTFNRAAYLSVCLNSLLNEISKINSSIYISDNASTDSTERVILAYKNKYSRIIYVKNETNLGFYRNILNVIKLAKTEYIWLFGDDDALKDDSIDIVISNLKKGYDYIILNSILYDAKLEKVRNGKSIACKHNKEYHNGRSGVMLIDLKKYAYHGYMSSMIIRTKIIQELIPKYEDKSFLLYDNAWVPLAIFYEAIKDCRGLFLCDPIVKNRNNPRESGKDYLNYMHIDRIKALEYLGSIGYDLKILKRALNFSIPSAVFGSIMSKSLHPGVLLFNEFVKKDRMIPFHIKCIIFLIDRVPLILIEKFRDIINKLLLT